MVTIVSTKTPRPANIFQATMPTTKIKRTSIKKVAHFFLLAKKGCCTPCSWIVATLN